MSKTAYEMMTEELISKFDDEFKNELKKDFGNISVEKFIENYKRLFFAKCDSFYAVGHERYGVFKIEKETLAISGLVNIYELQTMIVLPEYIIAEGYEEISVISTKDFSVVKREYTR